MTNHAPAPGLPAGYSKLDALADWARDPYTDRCPYTEDMVEAAQILRTHMRMRQRPIPGWLDDIAERRPVKGEA